MDRVDVALVDGSLVLSSSAIDPGDELTVDVTVTNTGTRPLSSVPVALFYDTGGDSFRLASSRSVALDPGVSQPLQLTWVANRSGSVALEVRVDPDDVLSESDESDNVLRSSVDVSVSTLPNLSVAASDISVTPETLIEGGAARVDVVVKNLGDGPAGAFDVELFTGDPDRSGLPLGSVRVDRLDGGSETVVSVDWDPISARGETPLFVIVDVGSAVDELDELDNRVFRIVDIEALADLLATTAQVRLSPAFARSGELVTIEASFTNAGEQASVPMAGRAPPRRSRRRLAGCLRRGGRDRAGRFREHLCNMGYERGRR